MAEVQTVEHIRIRLWMTMFECVAAMCWSEEALGSCRHPSRGSATSTTPLVGSIPTMTAVPPTLWSESPKRFRRPGHPDAVASAVRTMLTRLVAPRRCHGGPGSIRSEPARLDRHQSSTACATTSGRLSKRT